jgi:hypothetical protein
MPAGNTYVAIQSYTLAASQATISFTSIPSTYTDLVLVASAKSLIAGATDSFGIAVNGVTSATYSRTYLEGSGTAVTSGRQTSQIRIVSDYVMGTAGNDYGVYTWNFMNYSNTTTYKTVLYRGSNTSNTGGFNVQATVYLVPTTSAISSLTIATMNGPDWAIGSTFNLYGIAAA